MQFIAGEKLEAKDDDELDISTSSLVLALSTEGYLAYWAIEDFLDQVFDEDEGEDESEDDSPKEVDDESSKKEPEPL